MSETFNGVAWPDVVNHFVFADDGQGVYLTFGHVAPWPGPPAGERPVEVEPDVKARLFLSRGNAVALGRLLGEYADRVAAQDQGEDR